MRVFINYKQNVQPDHSLAASIEARLIREGHKVFRDESRINPSEKWPARIEREVRDCNAMVCLVSNASLRSAWVLNEIDLARQLEKRMLPVLIEKIDDSLRFQALNPRFMSIQWLALSGEEEVDLAKIVSALAEPRHACYRDLISAKLSEHGVPDARQILEALCGVLWQSHWPAAVFGTPLIGDGMRRLNGDEARSLGEAIRNQTEVMASMTDQNANTYLKNGETSIASRMTWQVQRLRCLADILQSLITSWNATCKRGREGLKAANQDKAPLFDTSDGERAFAPLDEHSARARFTPAPAGLVMSLRLPPGIPREQLGPAVRLCEYFE